MKTLTLLRHAKSGWDDAIARDVDRPLNPRGKLAAARIGQYLRDEGLDFDHVLASPAVRVVETLDHLARGRGGPLSAVTERRIYLASSATLLDLVNALPDAASRVLLVGHNPGLEDLVMLLVPASDGALRAEVEVKFPTASLAEMTFAVDRWRDVTGNGGRLARFVRPRDLDPSLGPEDGD